MAQNGTLTKVRATREIVVAGDDLRFKFGLTNENPDSLIATRGMTYIEELERDTHLASELQTRRQKLIEKGWEIRPYVKESKGKPSARDQEIRDFVAWSLDDMAGAFEKDIEGMLDCLGKGFSLSEINYKPINTGRYQGKLGFKSIRFKPARYFSFTFDKFGHYGINQIDPDPNGTPLPRSKFIHLVNGFNDENPYGESLTAKCAFWVWLKKNQAKFWAIFNERFGKPLVKVIIPANATPEELAKANEIIEEIATRAGIRVPENFQVEFLEATSRGDITYDNFLERCNKEISKLILGATLITEEGTRGQGSYAHSATHAQILETYTIFDSLMTAVAIKEQLIKRLVDYNFMTDTYPDFEWSGMSIASLISFSQSLGILAQSGLQIPVAYIHKLTGIPIARDGEPVLVPSVPASAAQGSANNIIGPDNRSMTEMTGIKFEELAEEIQEEVIEAELLKRRHLNRLKQIQTGVLEKVSAAVKKKSLNEPS